MRHCTFQLQETQIGFWEVVNVSFLAADILDSVHCEHLGFGFAPVRVMTCAVWSAVNFPPGYLLNFLLLCCLDFLNFQQSSPQSLHGL